MHNRIDLDRTSLLAGSIKSSLSVIEGNKSLSGFQEQVYPVVLPVVSTKGGEGKSTKAGNIAGYTADAGLKTLLIDGDYNQPTASSIFKLLYEAPCGLYELL
ncbi:nucleotide-binding protein, partial [Salmonella enterica]